MADDPLRLDGEGDVYHVSGLAWRRNHGKPSDAPSTEEEVFSACAAAALFRKETFQQADGFDERYFAYNEDVDLGFRLRLLGHRCLYVPSAKVSHVGSASTSRQSNTSIYYGHRNLVWTFFKNMPTGLLLLFFPAHLIMTMLYLVYFSFSGKGHTIWKAKLDALCQLPQILQGRFMIQSARKINANQIYLQMNKSWLLSHWVERVKSA
jgi:GT2 family glycosyltransferase